MISAHHYIKFFISLNIEFISNTIFKILSCEKQNKYGNADAWKKVDMWNWDLPDDWKLVGYKWVFTLKYKIDEIIKSYNARLMTKGYTQIYMIDY